MKKIIAGLVFLGLTTVVQAQTTLTLGGSCTGGQARTTTAVQDAQSLQAKNLHNVQVCLSHGLARTCTQAQLNALPNCGAGACGTIYAATATGTALFALDKLFESYFAVVGNTVTQTNVQDVAARTIANGTAVATNTECANAVGGTLGNGCTRFQIACRALSGGANDDCKQ